MQRCLKYALGMRYPHGPGKVPVPQARTLVGITPAFGLQVAGEYPDKVDQCPGGDAYNQQRAEDENPGGTAAQEQGQRANQEQDASQGEAWQLGQPLRGAAEVEPVKAVCTEKSRRQGCQPNLLSRLAKHPKAMPASRFFCGGALLAKRYSRPGVSASPRQPGCPRQRRVKVGLRPRRRLQGQEQRHQEERKNGA